MHRPVLILVAILTLGASMSANAAGSNEELAQQAAQRWLALIDSGDYGQSWDTAATLFKNALTKKAWGKSILSARAPFGKVESRQLKSATYAKQLPGAPDGEYVVIQYNTSFEKKKSSVETITPMMDGGSWKVSGYYIK
jgi:hypothetical protein